MPCLLAQHVALKLTVNQRHVDYQLYAVVPVVSSFKSDVHELTDCRMQHDNSNSMKMHLMVSQLWSSNQFKYDETKYLVKSHTSETEDLSPFLPGSRPLKTQQISQYEINTEKKKSSSLHAAGMLPHKRETR